MPYGKGTYGSKVGRPKKSTTAKRLSPGQKKIARQAGDPNKIEGKDFKALRRRRGMWWHTKVKALAEARKVAKATKSSTRSVSLKIGVHKSRSGGLTAAGRRKYNRATGSNLKAPQPQGGPRKRSFCARMSGVKGPMKDSKGRPTRKALALRKWKC